LGIDRGKSKKRERAGKRRERLGERGGVVDLVVLGKEVIVVVEQ
jgi:hypothetical protein